MYERVRVDMITNQADKQKIWEIMKSCFDTVDLCLSCDTVGHGKGCKTVSSSFRCLAVYTILAM